MTTHITLTGYNAGCPVCGCDKAVARAKGDTFSHIPYSVYTVAQIESWAQAANLCPQCVDLVIESWSEELLTP